VRKSQEPKNFDKQYCNAWKKKRAAKEDDNPDAFEIVWDEDDTNSFWLTTSCQTDDGPRNVKIRLDLRIFPGEIAAKAPLGNARTEANMEPYLPPPVGRMEFSLNPCKMLSQLMGPAVWKKVKGVMCCCICAVLCIAMIPLVAQSVISKIITKAIGLE